MTSQPRPRGAAVALIAAIIAFTAIAARPAYADFKLCNRMSYVIDAAIGIDDKGATATRGWFRLDPAQCRVVAQGQLTADRLMLHARALPLYGAAPIAQNGSDQLCITSGDFVIAAARECRSGQTTAAFTEIKPSPSEDSGDQVAYLAESSEYDDEQARLAGIQRLLVIAGYDAAPIDGVDGPKTQGALTKFFSDRNLNPDIARTPDVFATMIAAVQAPSPNGLTWCNDTPHQIMAAVGTDDSKTVLTRGWYRIAPGTCLHPDINGQPRRVFSFAEAVDATDQAIVIANKPLNWGGSTMLCTRPTKFELNAQGDCGARGLNTTGFASVEIDRDHGKTLRFTLP